MANSTLPSLRSDVAKVVEQVNRGIITDREALTKVLELIYTDDSNCVHPSYGNTKHCAEMTCENYINKHR